MVGFLPTTIEVRTMAISSELIYLGGKGGSVEIWDREKQNRIDSLQTGTNCKVLCLALDANEEVLVTGTSDGRIWVNNFFFLILFCMNYWDNFHGFASFFLRKEKLTVKNLCWFAGMGTELRKGLGKFGRKCIWLELEEQLKTDYFLFY